MLCVRLSNILGSFDQHIYSLGNHNVWECKITKIIERCIGSTSWAKIFLFIIKKMSNIFFFILSVSSLLDYIVVGYLLLPFHTGLHCLQEHVQVSLVHQCLVVGQWVFQRILRGRCTMQLQRHFLEKLSTFLVLGVLCHLDPIGGTHGQISFWCRFQEDHLLKMSPI